jgi:hypothetical protein
LLALTDEMTDDLGGPRLAGRRRPDTRDVVALIAGGERGLEGGVTVDQQPRAVTRYRP